MALCTWARLKLGSRFSSLVSFELEQAHSLWLKLTEYVSKVMLGITLDTLIIHLVPGKHCTSPMTFLVISPLILTRCRYKLYNRPLFNRKALYIQLNKMIYKEVPLPYPLDRTWFSVCVSVKHDELDLYLDGVPLLVGEDRDISSVKGKHF